MGRIIPDRTCIPPRSLGVQHTKADEHELFLPLPRVWQLNAIVECAYHTPSIKSLRRIFWILLIPLEVQETVPRRVPSCRGWVAPFIHAEPP